MKRMAAVVLVVAFALGAGACGRRGDPINPNDVTAGDLAPGTPLPAKQPTTLARSTPFDILVGK